MSDDFIKKDGTNKKSAYIVGAILGIATTLLSMLVFSAILLFLNIDRSYAAPFATVSVAIGGFCSSRYAAKKIGDKGYMVGLIIGLSVFVIITILSFIFGKNGLTINTLFHFIIIMLSSLVGGITGVNTNKHKKYI